MRIYSEIIELKHIIVEREADNEMKSENFRNLKCLPKRKRHLWEH